MRILQAAQNEMQWRHPGLSPVPGIEGDMQLSRGMEGENEKVGDAVLLIMILLVGGAE